MKGAATSVNGIISRIVTAAFAAQSLTGCGDAGPAFAGRALGGISPAAAPGVRQSWIDPRAKGSALLYVSDSYASTVFVYTYPQLMPAGQLTGFDLPQGLCVNRRNGNVWVTDAFKYDVVEYAHGGSRPLRTIHQQDQTTYVTACSVQPKTGDLAVVTSATDDPSVLLIFKPGSSKPKQYSDYGHADSMYLAGYDPHGNLFADGSHSFGPGKFRLEELAKGAGQLTNVPWNGPQIRHPGGVQFDGTYLAIGDAANHLIYRTKGGNVNATISLDGACWVSSFFVDHGLVIAPSACGSSGDVLIYDYPAAGAPVKRLSGFAHPFGAVVSR